MFGPYMNPRCRAQQGLKEPSALAIISFALTWAAIGLFQLAGSAPARPHPGGRAFHARAGPGRPRR
ncbi:MAG: hypothetical protein U0Z44_05695 [Kouleothrix sp.]